MVHALHEAYRVLKSNGILVDLRPAAVHRHVGIAYNGRLQELGIMREMLDDDHAADRAVADIQHEGLFKIEWRTQFDSSRVMDGLDEFRTWIGAFDERNDIPSHDWLIQKVERALAGKRGKTKIVVRGPLKMGILRKVERVGIAAESPFD